MTPMLDRRMLLALAGAAAVARPGAAPAQTAPGAAAKPPTQLFLDARSALAAGRPVTAGRVMLDLPRLAENGNSVTLKVTVDSPQTPASHVKTIHLLSEQNPIALLARFHLSPRAGLATISTSVRLMTTQNVHAIAEMSDGTLWSATGESVVLLAACLDAG